MADKSWKAFERRCAIALGGTRTGAKGFALPDVSGIPLGVECKHQGKLSLRKRDIQQAKKNSRELPWCLVLKEKHSKEAYAIIDFNYFVSLWLAHTRKENNA